jgi:hypothetical protein
MRGAAMAKKEMTLVIRARNAVAAGLKSVMGSIKSLGGGILKASKWIATGVAAATAAIGAVAAKALSAYATQEKATRALASSLAASGDDAATLVPKLKAVASAIQDETGADDDAVVAGMARLRLLGVTSDKLGDAARATIALKSVGLEETAAQKAVAMAMQGSYDMLSRYVPALRTAKDETEKARIVNELFAKGYQQQKDLLNTTSGAWAALKGRIGDVWEEIGKAIERSFGISDALNKAGDAVKKFGELVAEWIDSEKFKALQQSIQGVLNALTSGGESRGQALDAMVDVIKAGFYVAAENAVDVLKRAAVEIGGLIADGFKKLIHKTPYTKAEIDAAAGQIGQSRGKSIYERIQGKVAIRKGDWVGFSGDQQKAIKEQIERNRLEAQGAVVSENLTVAENKLALAMQRLQKIAKDNAPAEFVVPPEPPVSAPPVITEPEEVEADAQEAADARLAAEKEAAQEAADARIAAEKEANDKLIEERERLLEEYAQAEKDARAKRWEELKEDAEKELALAEELAGKKIAAFIQEGKDKAKADKDAANEAEREADRAKILADRQRKGGRLSKQQQEWLDAFNAIAAAKGQLQPLRDQIKVAEDNLAELRQTNRTLAAIQKGLDQNHDALNALLKLG